jgi:tetratricopeptide (TPR) repeat protein
LTARSWIFIALSLCVLAPRAWADDPALAQPKAPEARAHYTQGNRLYRIRKLDDAVAAYQAGALIEPVPVFDYNLGQCYRKLGRHADALWHYERFLRNGRPEGELHALVTGFVRQLREELARTAPAPPPPPSSAAADLAATPRRAEPTSMPVAVLSQPAAMPGEQWYADRLGWGLVAGGAAAAGVATYLRVRAPGLRDEADSSLDEDQRLELRAAARARSIGGAVVGVGGAALIAIGVIKLASHRREPPRAASASWSLGLSGHGLAAIGSF